MKTFASILLLLASGQAAAQSAKAVKMEMSIANIELLGSVSAEAIDLIEAQPVEAIELPRVIELSGAKSAKGKAGKAKAEKMGDAKAEKESSSKAAKLFKGGAKSGKAYDAKAGKESFTSSKSAKKSVDSKSVKSRRFLGVDGSGDHSMSLDLAAIELPAIELPVPEVAATVSAKALKTSAYSKTSKGPYSAKSAKAQPKRRSIDPNDSDPVKALSFIDYARAQAPDSAELADSSAGVVSVATLALLPLAAAVAHSF